MIAEIVNKNDSNDINRLYELIEFLDNLKNWHKLCSYKSQSLLKGGEDNRKQELKFDVGMV